MKLQYLGKKIERDDFGNVKKRFAPCAQLEYKEAETKAVMELLDATGYRYDLFGDGDENGVAMVTLADREDFEEFRAEFNNAKLHRDYAPGTMVYAIVKGGDCRLTIVKAEVLAFDEKTILLAEPKRYHGFAHTEWTFPAGAVGKEILKSKAAAATALKRIEKNVNGGGTCGECRHWNNIAPGCSESVGICGMQQKRRHRDNLCDAKMRPAPAAK